MPDKDNSPTFSEMLRLARRLTPEQRIRGIAMARQQGGDIEEFLVYLLTIMPPAGNGADRCQ